MDVTPGSDPLAFPPAPPAACAPQRGALAKRFGPGWLQSVLVGVVFALGLLQGSRAALGGIPRPAAPESPAPAEAPPGSELEADTIRGHFYRPQGSNAMRPVLRLRPSRWLPACAEPGC